MRNRDQILADALDGLIKRDTGRIPEEVGDLVQVGLRLHNECPEIDPGFMEGLGRRLDEEWTALQPVWLAMSRPVARASALGARLLLRGLATGAVALALVLGALLAFPGLRHTAEAGLSRMIMVFEHTEVEQQPRLIVTPAEPELVQHVGTLAEAQEAAGFALHLPAYVPQGMGFQGADIQKVQGLRQVVLRYAGAVEGGSSYGDRESAETVVVREVLTRQTADEVAFSLQIGLEKAERIVIAGRLGLWVPGNWSRSGRWVRSAEGGLAMVQDGDVFLVVFTSLGRQEGLRVVESLLD